MTRPGMRRPGAARRWAADLAMGARLTAAGGRDGWTRTVMTALGIGVGVALLLLAAAVPGVTAARDQRTNARADVSAWDVPTAGPDTLLIAAADTEFRGQVVRGRLVRAEGPQAPVPPGLSRIPAAGEAVASPALRRLLDSDEGELLRPRLPYRVVATIADTGLAGPTELAWYAGDDTLTEFGDEGYAARIRAFGDPRVGEGLGPVLLLLVVVIVVVMLLPVAVFVAAAVRFGSEQRDRRLAALRLLGADRGMARRIAAGEALMAAVMGILAGVAFFLLARRLAELVTVAGLSVFAGDIRPDPVLAGLIVLVVPALAVGVTLLALRGVLIEPLGVVRRSVGARGRLWWRIPPPLVGAALLYPLLGGIDASEDGAFNVYQVAAGVLLLLVGVAVLLPWLVEAVVARLGGGAVAWQLAVRRMQLSVGTSGRVVNGIAVAVAGAVALQMLFTGVEPAYRTATGNDLTWAQVLAQVRPGNAAAVEQRLRAVPGVTDLIAVHTMTARGPEVSGGDPAQAAVIVADCAALRRLATLSSCADGDVFRTAGQRDTSRPGDSLTVDLGTGPWPLPADARRIESARAPTGGPLTGFLVTFGAVPPALRGATLVELYLRTDLNRPDTIELVRNAVGPAGPTSSVLALAETAVTKQFADVRRGLFVAAVATLLLIALSLLVGILEQLRERRRLLAVLLAFGTRRRTLGWSVLWQVAVPVGAGLALAVPAGFGLGALLLLMVREPVRLDGLAAAQMAGVAGGTVLLVTLLSLPALWRIMRADGLRTE